MIRLNGHLMRKKLDATLKNLEEGRKIYERFEDEKNEEKQRDS